MARNEIVLGRWLTRIDRLGGATGLGGCRPSGGLEPPVRRRWSGRRDVGTNSNLAGGDVTPTS
jgi:hypothetical protein